MHNYNNNLCLNVNSHTITPLHTSSHHFLFRRGNYNRQWNDQSRNNNSSGGGGGGGYSDNFSRRGRSNNDRWLAQSGGSSRWSNSNGNDNHQHNGGSRFNRSREESNPSSKGIECNWSALTSRNERTEALVT